MVNSISAPKILSPELYQRIGRVATEWTWIEMFQSELLAVFCRADHGSMYVITQNVSASSVTDWLRTLTDINVSDVNTREILSALFQEIDSIRAERNIVIHGAWTKGDVDTHGSVQTLKWERKEVIKNEIWSIDDLDDLISNMQWLQHELAGVLRTLGYLKPTQNPTSKPKQTHSN